MNGTSFRFVRRNGAGNTFVRAGALVAFFAGHVIGEAATPQFADPTPVAEFNSPTIDHRPWVSKDGLEAYFSSDRDDAATCYHIYHTTRTSTAKPFGPAVHVTGIDHPSRQFAPYVSEDGLTMYFASRRDGGLTDISIWEITRPTSSSPWKSATQRLVPGANTPGIPEWNGAPQITSGGLELYYNRATYAKAWDLYRAVRSSTSVDFTTSEPLTEFNTENMEHSPFMTRDKLMFFFCSDRPGGVGGLDLYVAARDSIHEPFGPPVNLRNLNSAHFDIRPFYHEPSKTLYFTSNPDGGDYDVYAARLLPPAENYNLIWSTYHGGGAEDGVQDVAGDGAGNIYVVGETTSADFPTSGAMDAAYGGAGSSYGDAHVAKFSSDGSLLWATYLGGNDSDTAYGIALDGLGGVYITGSTKSTDFPTTGGYDTSYAGGTERYGDAFLVKLDQEGKFVWGTYLGGADADLGWGIDVDGIGNVYVSGQTASDDFPTSAAEDGSYNGGTDAFVTKFAGDGRLLWSTYLGGSQLEHAYGTAIDGSRNVYVVGRTQSADFPTTRGHDTTYNGQTDIFVTKYDPAGSGIWSTYIGGSDNDLPVDLAAGGGGIYITGTTDSADFPTTNGFDTTFAGGTYDGFLTKLDEAGVPLWSTYFGGAGSDVGRGVSIDANGEVWIGGNTDSTGFPGFPALVSYGPLGGGNALAMKFTPDGAPISMQLFGGSADDQTRGILADGTDSVYAVGITQSSDFPVANGFDLTYNGGTWDGFVAKLTPGPVEPQPSIDVSPEFLFVMVEAHAATPVRTIEVRNGGSGILDYEIDTEYDWLVEARPPSGQSTGAGNSHEIYIRTPWLPPGDYLMSLEVTGNASNSPVTVPIWVTVTPSVPPPANLVLSDADVGPTAPISLEPGDSLVVGAMIANEGDSAAGPFWVEVWGSRTGGLTLDRFLAWSLRLTGGLAPGGAYSWVESAPLFSVPDGPYTVVYVADRPGEVAESNERDNRAVVAGKRVLIIRPHTNVDLAVSGFSIAPNPAQNGQQISLGGTVSNQGGEPSGRFWIEFWGSWDSPYPSLNFHVCDSILVENLNPGESIDLVDYPRPLYSVPEGRFMVGCFVDRDDGINELDETNNYQFVDGQTFNQPSLIAIDAPEADPGAPDIVISWADFVPAAPLQSAPGDPVVFDVAVLNAGGSDTGPFWLEYWGSRHGGVTLDDFLVISDRVDNVAPGQTLQLSQTKTLQSVPDGPYTVVVVADRPTDVVEADEANNRLAVAGKRLLTIRPQTGANLTIEDFEFAPPGVITVVQSRGKVRNTGTADSGSFWIEFWACPGDPDYPWLGAFANDSILVANLAPAEEFEIPDYMIRPYPMAPGFHTIICFVDRLDQVIETDETDNYQVHRNFFVPAP